MAKSGRTKQKEADMEYNIAKQVEKMLTYVVLHNPIPSTLASALRFGTERDLAFSVNLSHLPSLTYVNLSAYSCHFCLPQIQRSSLHKRQHISGQFIF